MTTVSNWLVSAGVSILVINLIKAQRSKRIIHKFSNKNEVVGTKVKAY